MTDAQQFQLSRWCFLCLLSLVYFLAFASISPQLVGLVGSEGLLPVAQYLERAQEFYGRPAYYQLPTMLWFSSSDAALQTLGWCGMVVSGLALVGIAPLITFPLLWLLYLSLAVAGQTFLSFQWDTLLLETGLIACLYAPRGWWPGRQAARPPTSARWLLWSLAFKVTFLSGVTKLVSGDPTWRSLSAMTFHYETQPIPTWTSWFAHHLPEWLQQATAAGTLGVELAVPFLILAPIRFRKTRAGACLLLSALQIGIGLTGNYGFFNVLTIVLYLALLDDGHIRRLLPSRVAGGPPASGRQPSPEPRLWRVAVGTAVLGIGVMSAVAFWHEATYTRPHPEWSTRLVGVVQPFRSINGYGLFRTMTTERPEIVIEGSVDGAVWTEYEFRWKPGDLDRRPRFVEPHMPRLDWLMWFAALDPFTHQHWLGPLVERLLAGTPAVLALLGENPFPDAPPQFVRLAIYDYRFTTPDEGAETGDWWRRELRSYLSEPMSLP